MAAEAAGFTHGHPTGKLASGALAVLITGLLDDRSMAESVDLTLRHLRRHEHHQETTRAIDAAVRLAADGPADAAAIESLGEGWVAEEALAMAVYAALARYRHGHPVDRPLPRQLTPGRATTRRAVTVSSVRGRGNLSPAECRSSAGLPSFTGGVARTRAPTEIPGSIG
ncbi:MAG: ADP-ribosylglycohydrolase family protein [Propionibacterium sp.]|nr:ADP-ribosylglycohydrolase family protein [Propionibacterium sp.]